ncbi:MAG: hypothetical protein JW702_11075 [Clostridiales bacterium]|nr:hypothetical protein [Clostridiales bacterium]
MSEDNKKTEDLMKRAFRWPKFGVAQKLVSQHLVLASFSNEPNAIIEHVAQASSIVEGLGQKVKELDFEKMRKINAIHRGLSNFTTKKLPDGAKCYGVNFGFPSTEENYQKYISNWETVGVNYYPSQIHKHRQPGIMFVHKLHYKRYYNPDITHEIFSVPTKDYEKTRNQLRQDGFCPRCFVEFFGSDRGGLFSTDEYSLLKTRKTTVVDDGVFWSFFFEAITCLTENGLKSLQGAFLNWAVDECGKAKAVIGNLLSPSTFEETVKLLGNNINKKPERNNDF